MPHGRPAPIANERTSSSVCLRTLLTQYPTVQWKALVGPRGPEGSASTRAAPRRPRDRAELENHYTARLREEGEDRHAENAGKLYQLLRDMGGVRSEILHLCGPEDTLPDRLDHLSDTITKVLSLWPITLQPTPPSRADARQ